MQTEYFVTFQAKQDFFEQNIWGYGLRPQTMQHFYVSDFCSQENAEHRFGFLSGSSPVCISVGRSGAVSTHFEAPADGIYSYKTGDRLL